MDSDIGLFILIQRLAQHVNGTICAFPEVWTGVARSQRSIAFKAPVFGDCGIARRAKTEQARPEDLGYSLFALQAIGTLTGKCPNPTGVASNGASLAAKVG
jgi:hypothetical protein